MAEEKFRWFLSLQMTLYLFLVFVHGNEDADDAYRSGRSLVLEYFLPINPMSGDVQVPAPAGREKRDVEGSGEDETVFKEIGGETEEADNSTQNAFARLILEGGEDRISNSTEGSGEVEEETSTEEEDVSAVPVVADFDNATATESEEAVGETTTEDYFVSTEMVFDRSEDLEETLQVTTDISVESTTVEVPAGTTVVVPKEVQAETTTAESPKTTELSFETTTAERPEEPSIETTTTEGSKELFVETTTAAIPGEPPIATTVVGGHEEPSAEATTAEAPTTIHVPDTTKGLPATREPILEEVVKVSHKTLEAAAPGNVLQKENLSLGADPLLIANTRLMDSEETVQLSSTEPKRLGAYIVIGLILLSFSSLVGYITFRKRMNRKRLEFESNQESNDTEKALLSLSDYKDNSEQDENHLKNNEKAAIVVKSNRFEKNTNFSSPKNLNTIANEKNIEKDNVLKSTAENLTQVIIEDSPKEVDEDKNVPNMERLIVKTRIDQDSIPRKPIIVNRSSTGYLPVPQDGS